MSYMNLRSKLIRLAHKNPELRGDLLPLLSRLDGQKTAGLSNPTSYAKISRIANEEGHDDVAYSLAKSFLNWGTTWVEEGILNKQEVDKVFRILVQGAREVEKLTSKV